MNTINLTTFQRAEKKLNALLFDGMPLGYFSTHYFDRTWHGMFEHGLWKANLALCKTLVKALGKRHYLKNRHVRLFYYKSGNNRHHQAMEKVVRKVDSPTSPLLVIGPLGCSDINSSQVFYHSGLSDLFKAVSFQRRHRRQINGILKDTSLTIRQRYLYHVHLTMQMLKARSALRFLQQQRHLTHLCVDYDRNGEACLLVAAAITLHVYTIALQHGIINPPTGYCPILADQFWAWGEMTKQQLLCMGESAEKIICVGTPIIEPITLSAELGKAARQTHHLKQGRTYLLALSNPNRMLDEKLAAFFSAVKTRHGGPDDNFLVKTHPSHPQVNYSWLETRYGLKHLPLFISYTDVMNMTDVMLSHSSGLGAEALHFGKQVGIIDIPGYDAGSGLELHKHLGVPLLREPDDIIPLLIPVDQVNSEALSRQLFQTTGTHAAQAIADRLKAHMN